MFTKEDLIKQLNDKKAMKIQAEVIFHQLNGQITLLQEQLTELEKTEVKSEEK